MSTQMELFLKRQTATYPIRRRQIRKVKPFKSIKKETKMNFQVRQLSTASGVKYLFKEYHYLKSLARGCPDIYELYDDTTGEVLGAAQIGIPATLHINKDTHKEIRRFVLVPGVPKNTASYFLSRIIKDIKLRYPKMEKLIAYSDPNAGHKGTIYLASNFKFVGQGKPGQAIKINGKKVHPRTVFNKNVNVGVSRKAMNAALESADYKWVKTQGKLKFEMEL